MSICYLKAAEEKEKQLEAAGMRPSSGDGCGREAMSAALAKCKAVLV